MTQTQFHKLTHTCGNVYLPKMTVFFWNISWKTICFCHHLFYRPEWWSSGFIITWCWSLQISIHVRRPAKRKNTANPNVSLAVWVDYYLWQLIYALCHSVPPCSFGLSWIQCCGAHAVLIEHGCWDISSVTIVSNVIQMYSWIAPLGVNFQPRLNPGLNWHSVAVYYLEMNRDWI